MSSKVLNFINANKKSTPINIPIKDMFTFGKYKGKTYQEVFDIDKPYIAWILQADPKYYSRAQLFYTNLLDGK
jgi:uncharacterized protein (DUF3820 family)